MAACREVGLLSERKQGDLGLLGGGDFLHLAGGQESSYFVQRRETEGLVMGRKQSFCCGELEGLISF